MTDVTLSRLLRNLTEEDLISIDDRNVAIHRIGDLKAYAQANA